MNLKLVDVPRKYWATALEVAKKYLSEYPDKKVGFHAGVVYYTGSHETVYYVYKTKTQLVVRGERKDA